MSITTDNSTDLLQRLTADRLRAAGLAVTIQGDEVDSRVEFRTSDARWTFDVTDAAQAELAYWPADDATADPDRLVELATTLLTGRPPASRHREHRPDDTVMAQAGFALRAAGFAVELTVFPDEAFFDVCADITVTNPGDATATVKIDDASLIWQRDYFPEYGAVDPWCPFHTHLPDPDAVAAAIADTIIRALTPHRAIGSLVRSIAR